MREYFTILQIPEYAVLNQKGDCGVQALLFITRCRCAGIPARWQSGLFVTPYSQGCHDWAQFYIAPYGWLFADPSFGGSGYRSGNLEKQEHYFGNLDPWRMVANSEFKKALILPRCNFAPIHTIIRRVRRNMTATVCSGTNWKPVGSCWRCGAIPDFTPLSNVSYCCKERMTVKHGGNTGHRHRRFYNKNCSSSGQEAAACSLQVETPDQITSLYGAVGKLLYENSLPLEQISEIVLTGVGSTHIREDIYGIPPIRWMSSLCYWMRRPYALWSQRSHCSQYGNWYCFLSGQNAAATGIWAEAASAVGLLQGFPASY